MGKTTTFLREGQDFDFSRGTAAAISPRNHPTMSQNEYGDDAALNKAAETPTFAKGGRARKMADGGPVDDMGFYDKDGRDMDSLSPGSYSKISKSQAEGRQAGTQDYPRIKRVQDAATQPVKAIRKATDYIGEKYGDLRDSASSAISGDPKNAEFRAGQRDVRKGVLGYAKGGKTKPKVKAAAPALPGGKTMPKEGKAIMGALAIGKAIGQATAGKPPGGAPGMPPALGAGMPGMPPRPAPPALGGGMPGAPPPGLPAMKKGGRAKMAGGGYMNSIQTTESRDRRTGKVVGGSTEEDPPIDAPPRGKLSVDIPEGVLDPDRSRGEKDYMIPGVVGSGKLQYMKTGDARKDADLMAKSQRDENRAKGGSIKGQRFHQKKD